MRTFLEYLYEVVISGSGVKAAEHKRKYIDPHVGSDELTHTLASAHSGLEPGSKIKIASTESIGGKLHVRAHDESGTEHLIPVSKLNKPKATPPKYSDEHAFKNVWNHAVNTGISTDKEKIKAELEKAKTDETHPLHFNNVSNEGFAGKKKDPKAKANYEAELNTAFHTVHGVASHPDFKKEVKNKTQAKVAGATRTKLSKSWESHGASNGTSKADITIGGKGISYKKAGGSQLMSGESAEATATYHHAAAKMLKDGHITPEQHAELKQHINNVGAHLKAMKTSRKEDIDSHVKDAQKIINLIHKAHPKLNGYVHHEAATGDQKFETSEGKATHIITSADKNNTPKIDNPNDYLSGKSHMIIPRIAKPKGNNREGNLKIDKRE